MVNTHTLFDGTENVRVAYYVSDIYFALQKMLRNCQQSKGTCALFDCSCFIILKVMMDIFKMLQLFASFIFHYGVANLNKYSIY